MAYSKTELLRERAWRDCKGKSPRDVDALIRFMERYCRIQHPSRGAILIPLRPAQLEILDTWLIERYSIVLKARQIGWSTLAALYCLWLAFFWPDQLIIMLSIGDREAGKLLAKSTFAYGHLPMWMKLRGPKRTSRNVKKLSFDNGSVIESLPSKEDPARSSTASLVIIDEWAFFDNPEEAWASIEPIADVGGRVIGLSTANGWGNFFHTMWVRARSHTGSKFKAMFYPWWANTERDEDWYAAELAAKPQAWMMSQEYPDNEEEAFIKSGNPVFDTELLSKLIPRTPMMGRLVTDDEGFVRFAEEPKGPLHVWHLPLGGDSYCVGADTAQGLEHGDYSSAHVLNLAGDVVATWHGHVDAWDYGLILAELGLFYGTALMGVESNNHGLTTLKCLLEQCHYPRIFYRRTKDSRYERGSEQLGWYTSTVTKPLMIDELSTALKYELTIEDEETIAELMHYVRDEKGQTSGSPFDDRVVSLAVAQQMRRYIKAKEYAASNEPPYGSFEYHMRRVTHAENEKLPLGWQHVRPAA